MAHVSLKITRSLLVTGFLAGIFPIDYSLNPTRLASAQGANHPKRIFVESLTGRGTMQFTAEDDLFGQALSKKDECTAANGGFRGAFVYLSEQVSFHPFPEEWVAKGAVVCHDEQTHAIPWSVGYTLRGALLEQLERDFWIIYWAQAEACETDGGYPSYQYYGVTYPNEYKVSGVVHCDATPPWIEGYDSGL